MVEENVSPENIIATINTFKEKFNGICNYVGELQTEIANALEANETEKNEGKKETRNWLTRLEEERKKLVENINERERLTEQLALAQQQRLDMMNSSEKDRSELQVAKARGESIQQTLNKLNEEIRSNDQENKDEMEENQAKNQANEQIITDNKIAIDSLNEQLKTAEGKASAESLQEAAKIKENMEDLRKELAQKITEHQDNIAANAMAMETQAESHRAQLAQDLEIRDLAVKSKEDALSRLKNMTEMRDSLSDSSALKRNEFEEEVKSLKEMVALSEEFETGMAEAQEAYDVSQGELEELRKDNERMKQDNERMERIARKRDELTDTCDHQIEALIKSHNEELDALKATHNEVLKDIQTGLGSIGKCANWDGISKEKKQQFMAGPSLVEIPKPHPQPLDQSDLNRYADYSRRQINKKINNMQVFQLHEAAERDDPFGRAAVAKLQALQGGEKDMGIKGGRGRRKSSRSYKRRSYKRRTKPKNTRRRRKSRRYR